MVDKPYLLVRAPWVPEGKRWITPDKKYVCYDYYYRHNEDGTGAGHIIDDSGGVLFILLGTPCSHLDRKAMWEVVNT